MMTKDSTSKKTDGAPKEYTLPTGLTEFNEFADRLIKKAGQFADRDSMVYAIAMELIHSDPKTPFSDEYFVTRLRKAAANQVASQVVNDIREKQAAAKAAQQAVADTTTREVATNENQKN